MFQPRVLCVVFLALGLVAASAQALQPSPPPTAGVSESLTGSSSVGLADDSPGDRLPAEVWVDNDYTSGGGNDGHTWGVDAFATIQTGIDGVDDPGTVHVAAGTYVENVTVNKAVTIDGAGEASTLVYPAVSNPGTDAPPSWGGSQVIVIQAHNVVISDLTVDGDNPALNSGVIRHGANLDARNGIIEADGPWNNLSVQHCTVRNIYLRGIYARSAGSGFDIGYNTVSNVDGGTSSIAIFVWNGSGLIHHNTVSYANDAISANWSKGVTYEHNVVTDSGSGIHSDNNGGMGGGTADIIRDNQVSNSAAYGYGIWAFFPYVNTVIDQNAVTNVDYGLFAWGGAGGTAQFTANTVDGENKAGSIGVYVTCGPDYWGSWQSNVSAYFLNNTVSNTTYGYYVESDETTPFFSTTVTLGAPQIFVGVTTDVAIFGLGPMAITGLTGSTVEVASPGYIQKGIDLANSLGTVTVAAGSYAEAVTIGKVITLQGAGLTTILDPPSDGPGIILSVGGASVTDRLTVKDLKVTGATGSGNAGSGISVVSGLGDVSHITLDGVESSGNGGHGFAINYSGTMSDLVIYGCDLSGNGGTGFRIPTSLVSLDGLAITDGHMDGNVCGWEAYVNNLSDPGLVTNVTVTGTTFSNNASKGIYVERLDHAVLDAITVNSSGTAGAWAAGIDVNLKYRAYQDIAIQDATVTGCGSGDAVNGVGITVKARDDSGYAGNPATLDNVDVLDCTITGCQNGIRFGEPARNNFGPTNVTVRSCDLSGSTAFGLVNASQATTDASGNWWGDATPAGVVAEITGTADYTPWLAAGTDLGDPGFQGDFSTLWVDDDSPQIGTTGRIQEGVNLVSGSTVHIAPGTYHESITIDRSVTLTGDPGDPAVAGPGASAPVLDGTGFSSRAAILIDEGVSGVIIEGLEICNYGPNDDTNADGVCAWNDGTSNVTVRDNHFHHLGWNAVLTGNEGEGVHTNWQMRYNVVDHWYAYGLELTNCVNSSIAYNQISDATSDWASAVVVQARASGTRSVAMGGITVDHNTIVGDPDRAINTVAYAYDTGSAATIDGVAITNNTVSGSFNVITAWHNGAGTSAYDNLTITGNTFSISNPKGANYAVHITDIGGTNTYSDNDLTLSGTIGGGGAFFHGINLGGATTGTWTMEENSLLGNLVGASSVGLRIRGTLPVTAVVDVGSTVFSGWNRGVLSDALSTGVDVNLHYVSVAGNTAYGMENGAGAEIDAEYCWWGHASGPSGSGTGSGVPVSASIDFDPWIGKTGTGNIVFIPDPEYFTTTGSKTVTVRYLGGASGLLYSWQIRMHNWTGAVVDAVADDVTKGDTDWGVFFKQNTGSADEITVSGSLVGNDPGTTGPCDLFRVTFHAASSGRCYPALDVRYFRDRNFNNLTGTAPDAGDLIVVGPPPAVSVVALTNVTLTGITNNYCKNGDVLGLTATVMPSGDPLFGIANITANLTALGGGATVHPTGWDDVSGLATWADFTVAWATEEEDEKGVTITATDGAGQIGTGSDTIILDNVKPEPVTDLTAAPGHKKVTLAWANGTDTYYAGAKIVYNPWTNYPRYGSGGGPGAPDYPLTPGDTDVAYEAAGTGTVWSYVPRDIYYFSAYAYDMARNYAEAASTARATNYWLGDVRFEAGHESPYDGEVYTADISALGASYYAEPLADYECDVAQLASPNDPRGIPAPDGHVDFEDLMIFALNFGVVTPTLLTVPPIAVPDGPRDGEVAFSIELPEAMSPGSEFEARVMLSDADGVVQGARFVVTYDANMVEYLGSRPGSLVQGIQSSFFMPVLVEGQPDISAAALGEGVTFGHSGELAKVRFRVVGEGTISLGLRDIQARNVLNEDLLAGSSDVVEGPGEVKLPTEVFLHSAQPNPFGGATTLSYGLPEAAPAKLAVYDVSGRLVRVLAEGQQSAGEHPVLWDGRDEAGSRVATGLYLYRLETKAKTITRKLIVTE